MTKPALPTKPAFRKPPAAFVRKTSPPAQPDRFHFDYKADHWIIVSIDGKPVLRVQARDEYQREVLRMAIAYGANDMRRA